MREVRVSRPAGIKEKKGKIMHKEPGKYKEEKERRMELGKEGSRQKDRAK